jgi:tetratricopeptide (TPR) repeat protein
VAEQNLGNALRLLGRVAEARGHAEAAIALSRELALQRLESSSLQVLARAVAEDDPGKADGIVSEAIQIRRSLNERKRLALSLLPRGIWRAETSRWADARADLVEAFEIATAPETKALHLEASAAAALAWVDVASGEHASASSGPWLARALDALGRLDAAREPEDALEANWFLWRATGERAHLAEAVRFLHLSVAGLPDEFRASALSNVRLRREIRDAWEASGAGSVQR